MKRYRINQKRIIAICRFLSGNGYPRFVISRTVQYQFHLRGRLNLKILEDAASLNACGRLPGIASSSRHPRATDITVLSSA
jgi:hypothetical protein